MKPNGPRATILYYDGDHRRRQITIPTTQRDNLHLDILDYDAEHGTNLYDVIKPRNIRKVIRRPGPTANGGRA